MRTLLLFRGSAGCGKSTFIKENNLEQYCLSADNIRLMIQSPVLKTDGNYGISQKNDKKVWQLLFDILEQRMIRGEFIVVDATNSKTTELNRYKNLAESYRYRIICIDMTDVPKDVCKQRNADRLPTYKRVPGTAIDNMYSRFETQKVPSGIKVIKPEELWETIKFSTLDFSHYEKIHHIGDIHGCNTVLQGYLKDGLKDNELYIFLGDFIDRGIENADILNFLFEIQDKDNVILLEGNHERSLWMYGNDMMSGSREFEQNTKPQLINAKIDKKKLRMLYRRLRQLAYYTYGDKVVLVTHGGISHIPNNLQFIATEQMIRGVGEYKEMEAINDSFIKAMSDNYYQIHGHRNVSEASIQVNERCYCLEGGVEFGDNLRVVTLDKYGFKAIELKNNVFKEITKTEEPNEKTIETIDNKKIIEDLRNNSFINERKFGNISSFNFSPQAFKKGIWDEQTIRARGLFFNTNTGDIVCRSFNKFFNINQMENTKLDNLKYVFKFPVTAYVKYNGFLGLLGYDKESDELIIASKSTIDSNFAGYFRTIFYNTFDINQVSFIKEYLKENDCTLVFEVIDPVNDPHMIEYDTAHLILLEIVNNNIEFIKKDYCELEQLGKNLNIEYKEKAIVLNNWNEFYNWYQEVTQDDYKYNGEYIEGFVLEDTNGFMTKVKLQFYSFWKFMRSVKDEVCRNGYIQKTSALNSAVANEFYGWLRTLTKEELRSDIITLRKRFEKS